jgi:ParB-like chromosome segregation protein Spo0J
MKDKIKVHPIAQIFPMMTDEELDELAADIKANGLQQPIVFDQDGVLIDGRNRWEACRRAEIEPETTVLNGNDVLSYILSANVMRRNLTKGQIAMIVAKSGLLETNNQKKASKVAKISQSRIAQAFVVVEFAADLIDQVISGGESLDDAYQIALDRKGAANSAEKQLERLREEAPDLAQRVTEEQLKLAEAMTLLRERKEEEIKHQKVTSRLFSDSLIFLTPQSNTPAELATYLCDAIKPKYMTTELSLDNLKSALETFKLLTNKLTKIYGQEDRSTKG